MPALSLGISPCPNDTYIFHALITGLVSFPAKIDLHLADVEELNKKAKNKTLDIVKVSVASIPHLIDNYAIANSGGAMGWSCGPIVIAKKPMSNQELSEASIAVPGLMTTANLLLNIHGGFKGKRHEMIFSEIMPAVIRGDVDCGLIIHEGRFVYEKFKLVKVFDTGLWWENTFATPLPLGAIMINKSLDTHLAYEIEKAIKASISYANANPLASLDYIKEHAQEMDEEIIRQHIKAFVNDFSLQLGEQGKLALRLLLQQWQIVNKRTIDLDKIFL